MTKGFLYVVFGEDYLIPFQTSIKYLKKITDLPIAVVTNLSNLTKDTIPNVDIIKHVDLPTNKNRIIRTQAIDYTPFDQTLLLDADCLPISINVNKLFDRLNTHDLGVLQIREFTNTITKIYASALHKTHLTTPLKIYSGGIILFNKSDVCKKFFDMWHKNWILTGEDRDMPALACTLKMMCNNLKIYLVEHCIDRDINADTIIFHAYGHHDQTIFSEFKKNKKFDKIAEYFTQITIKPDTPVGFDPLNPDLKINKKINYFDVGAFIGDTIKDFRNVFIRNNLLYSIYAFEPFDAFINKLKEIDDANLTIIPYAVSYDGKEKKLFLTKTDPLKSQGHSIDITKNNIDINNFIPINTIKFSQWFNETIKDENINILKMNIEGAEIELLQDIYESKIYKKINCILFSGYTKDGYPADLDKITITDDQKNLIKNIIQEMKNEGVQFFDLIKNDVEVFNLLRQFTNE